MKKAIFRLLVLAVLAGGGWYGYRWYKLLPSRQKQIATTRVQQSDVVIRAYTRGELHAVRAASLVAPNLNGTVQVTALAPEGALAHSKDLIVEYDDSELLASIDEDQMTLEQTDEQIRNAKATLGITDTQDALSLLKQRYAERTAELNVQKNPVTDLIDAKKNLLALEEAKRQIAQLETDIAMRKKQNESILAVLAEQRERNLLDLKRDQNRLADTKSLADIEGLVSIQQNRAGNFNFGQALPAIREGDTLQPGMEVAEVLDLSEVDVRAKIGELDRANLVEGQDVVLKLDSVPDKEFHGKIKTLSGTASADVFSGDPSKKFDVVFGVDMRGLLAGLGMKPAEVDRVMANAEAAAKRSAENAAGSIFAFPGPNGPGGMSGFPGQFPGGGGMPGGVMPAGMPGGAMPSGGARSGGPPTGGMPAGGVPAGAGSAAELMATMGIGASHFTEEDRKNARLPLAPGLDSQVQVLIRPGLLANVEITVEKIPHALHVPAQAIFQKNGKNLVYVQRTPGRFAPREVQLVKESESMMVLGGGVEPGEIVALADPTADQSAKKEAKTAAPSSNNPMTSMPGGK